MRKKVELPINVQMKVNDILSVAFPACILLAYRELYEYYLTHYMECYCFIGKGLTFGLNDVYDYACKDQQEDGIIRQEYYSVSNLSYIFKREQCVEFLKRRIDNNRYIISFMDEFYLPERDSTEINHFVHEFLIYGYDDYSMKFNVVAFNEKRVFASFKLRYNDVEVAIRNGLLYYHFRNIDWISERFMIVLQVDLKNSCLKNTKEIILNKINVYYKAKKFAICTDDIYEKAYYGVESVMPFTILFDKIISSEGDISEFMENGVIYRMVHAYAQHKLNINERLNYLVGECNYKYISEHALLIRMLCLKIWKLGGCQNKQRELIKQMRDRIMENYEQELVALRSLLIG